ncbi:hypothetical protein [Brassicibacter mesophilus]|uniref:hypothetical protein n=1 Tax=Brassicibacter mesophilus TaxID=745119 RepID=UPI003D1BD41F
MSKVKDRDREPINHVLDDLWERTQFEWDRMSIDDKMTMRTLMQVLKGDIDEYVMPYYDTISEWANLDINSIILSETSCDYKKINELMGVKCYERNN